ncbi:hypothetical protein CC86DRAFT_396428 [Ophiobolus disseminans]|uniref:DUF1593-domain-containing protein n=1 Tax=Ophiobolus disseminans TaxID=1469910 RepID=A0A6A6ZPR2_9PLEO|nr:hypothetical protein CC86DRAFT_396428 [Ophiobolus disseminans]
MYFGSVLFIGVLASTLPHVFGYTIGKPAKIRTLITTDMESDDLASLVRYVLYSNDLENQGLIYTSSKYHWEGDGKGTEFFSPNREYNTSQTSWRPTGTTTIENHLLKAYKEIGNVEFEGEMAKDTDGSNLIKKLLLDQDDRILYLQAWGGTNTIARALKSIEEHGLQDETYTEYIAPNWPSIRVEELSAAYATWGFNCNNSGQGNVRGLPNNNKYYQRTWIKENIQIGPLGSLYRSWLDGQTTFGGGDQLDVFGDPAKAPSGWCKPMMKYDFLSEGDNAVFNRLLTTGLQGPSNPTLGSWGGRAQKNSISPDLWVLVPKEKTANGSDVENWTTDRWVAAAQNDFAARMQWTLTPNYSGGNHAPSVKVVNGATVKAHAGSTVELVAEVSDPDGDQITTSWWQYPEEGTYPGVVNIVDQGNTRAVVKIPDDAKIGQNVSIIVQATDDGGFPLTHYDRIFLLVV